jgi:hypothetical protein
MDGATALAELKHVLYESPYDGAWTEDMLRGYLSEGQDKFCEDVGLFIDPTSYSITTSAGVQDYKLNPRIIRVFDARIALHPPLVRYDAKHGAVLYSEDNTAQPQYFRTDYAPGYIRFTPIPDGTYTVKFRVWRYAKRSFEDLEEFEIPAQFHRACIEYAAYKALSHHDMELQDSIKATDHLSAYQMYVQRGKDWLHHVVGVEYETVPNQLYVV